MKRIRAAVVIISVLAGGLTPIGAYASSTPPPAPGINSVFAFCNSAGGEMACFKANLHFINNQSFTLTNIELKDTLCDNKRVYVRIFSQAMQWERGHSGRAAWTFANEKGCGTTRSVPSFTLSDLSRPVSYVQVDLFAASFSVSTNVNRLRHGNPFIATDQRLVQAQGSAREGSSSGYPAGLIGGR